MSTDHDPLFRFHRWLANLRVLEIEEIKTVPYIPLSHPFIERLIGTIRREYLDRVFFWNAVDLEQKLGGFRNYYNEHRVHRSMAQRPHNAPAHRHLLLHRLIVTRGGSIVAVFFRLPLPHDQEFATNTPRLHQDSCQGGYSGQWRL